MKTVASEHYFFNIMYIAINLEIFQHSLYFKLQKQSSLVENEKLNRLKLINYNTHDSKFSRVSMKLFLVLTNNV